ncbi:hypothetical protein GCM10025778_23080 [Paeniglutamicibacter antarcticus]|uniref:HTH luxR-type domain-containing protein n=1 Tax=Paeniglutamicibacter antarcticus TaxID=494023 RepID=A0ABP9TNM3_9MICC
MSTANNIGSMLSDISKAAGESNFLLQPHAELLVAVDEIAAGCYISARGRLESVELQKETSPLDKEQLLVFELAKWSASLGTNNFEAASAQWATNGSSHHFLSRDGARAEQIRVLGWYCTIRRGELAAIPFSADSEDGIWACVRDFGWTDSLNRVLGVLCVAHTWVLEGHADKGQKLLKWALQEVRRVGALSLDHRYQLLLPSIAFLAHTVAFQLNDWNAASEVDAIVLDGAHSDAAAEKYVAYFACLRALTLGDMDIAAHLVNVLKVEEHLAGAQVIDGMTRCIDWAIGASQGSHVESEGLRQLSSPEILTTNSWCVAQLALLVRAGIDPNEQLLNDLYSMVRRALAQGLRYAAAETLSVMLALGHPVDEGLLAEIDANTNSQLVGLMEELNRALMGQNRDEELRVRFELAALGQREHVALLLRSQENTNVVVRRRAQRALVQGNGHLGRFDPSGRNARNERGERETSNWVELLTSREQTIAGMAAKGMRNLEIAKKCSISVRTVEGHLYQVHSKLNVRNRHGLKRLLQPATGGGEG